MRSRLRLPALALTLVLGVVACSSEKNPVAVDPGGDPGVEITDTVSAELELDPGETGIVFDLRAIFRKGYVPQSVDVAFPSHPTYDSAVEVDPVTTLAILRFDNAELDEARRTAFEGGVAADIIVYGPAEAVLSETSEESLVLDASGTLYALSTDLPHIPPPIVLKQDVPYLLQSEARAADGVLAWDPLGAESETGLVKGTQAAVDATGSFPCVDGSVAVGYTGKTGTQIDQVRLLCRTVLPDGSLGTETESGTLGISDGGAERTWTCPEGSVLVRDEGHFSTYIRHFRGRCLSLADVAMTGDNSAATLGTGIFGGALEGGETKYDRFCTDGSTVTGFQGRYGTVDPWVVEVGYLCREVSLTRWDVQAYAVDASWQKVYFTPVDGAAEPNTFVVRQGASGSSGWFWSLQDSSLALAGDPAAADHFVLEADADGWTRIRAAGTVDEYLVHREDGALVARPGGTERFRSIAANIEWAVVDRGTTYHQPVTPPARLDFAYAATIRNCSAATLTETVGNAQSRSRTTSVSTSESLQLFASAELSVGAKVGAEVEGKYGVASVKGSVEVSTSLTVTTSATSGTENTWASEQTETAEVSRVRSLEVPPFTAVEVFDAVRTIGDVHIPFTQVFRLSGTYQDTGAPVTGAEIVTQMLFNFVGGLPVSVSDQHVDVGIRGRIGVDRMFEAQTDVANLAGACN